MKSEQQGEIWKDIKGYEGLYQVSNLGRVKRISRLYGNQYKSGAVIVGEPLILKPCIKDNAYLYVSLRKDGSRNNKYIHRLVAEAFIPRDNGRDIVNHKDYDVTNNSSDNLEWVTQKENVQYSSDKMCHPKNTSRQTNTGYKYISMRKSKYRVRIKSKNVCIYDRTFGDLGTAIIKRNEVMKKWQIL